MDDFIGGNYKGQTEDQKKAKKWMKIIAVILVLLLLTCIALIGYMYYIQSTQLKISVDAKQVSSLEQVLIFDNGKVYIPIRAFASYVGYESSNGDYNQDKYTEDTTKCYVKSSNEVANFSLGSNKIYKTALDGSNDYEYYEIAEPVRMVNNQLCTTIEGAKIAFNIDMAYNQAENRVTINTLPYLVNYYTTQFQNAGIASGVNTFSNQKALLYNMMITRNAEGYYGVYDFNGKEILGMKYTSIKFVESTKEFIVTTAEKKMGIMAADSTTKISPEYDNIKQIDKDTGLYLVTNNKKQGVINEHGSIIIYIEYDQIGIDSSKFVNNNVQNQYLLYNNCIPVKRDKKWGLFDKNGNQIVELEYDDFGCTAGASSAGISNTNGVLLIADYEGIVVKQNNFYGLIDSQGKTLLPIVLQSIYSTTSEGQTTYSMIYNNQVMNVITYIQTYVKPNNQTNNNENNNTNTNNQNNTNTTTNEQTNNTAITNGQTNGNATNNEQTNTINNMQTQNTVQTSGNVVQTNTATDNNVNNQTVTPNNTEQ